MNTKKIPMIFFMIGGVCLITSQVEASGSGGGITGGANATIQEGAHTIGNSMEQANDYKSHLPPCPSSGCTNPLDPNCIEHCYVRAINPDPAHFVPPVCPLNYTQSGSYEPVGNLTTTIAQDIDLPYPVYLMSQYNAYIQAGATCEPYGPDQHYDTFIKNAGGCKGVSAEVFCGGNCKHPNNPDYSNPEYADYCDFPQYTDSLLSTRQVVFLKDAHADCYMPLSKNYPPDSRCRSIHNAHYIATYQFVRCRYPAGTHTVAGNSLPSAVQCSLLRPTWQERMP